MPVGGPAAMNGSSSEILYLLVLPKVCACLKATSFDALLVSVKGRPGVFGPFAQRAGKFKLKRKTSGKKMRVKLREIRVWFYHQLSTAVGEMWKTLNAKLRGHYQYYGINDNWPMLMAYRNKVRVMAKRHLSRRSQSSYASWGDFNRFTDLHPLANPRV